jgi:hypothetical protein
MKKTLLLLSFVTICFGVAKAELSLVVRPLSGSDCISALQKIGKLTYSGDSLLVYDAEQTLIYGELLTNVKHIRYSDEQTDPIVDAEQAFDDLQIIVYPNPTADVLYIDNAKDDTVRLYSADGRLLQVYKALGDRIELNISNYASGVYILVCNNKAFNIIKK